MATPNSIEPHAKMLQLISSFGVSHILHAAAELRLADLLHREAQHCEQLAAVTATDALSLRRLLRALVSIGVLTEDEHNRFAVTELGATLRTDVTGSLGAWALAVLGGESRAAWGDLIYSLRTGNTAFDHVFGTDIWAYRARTPASAAAFDAAMANLVELYGRTFVASYPFAGTEVVVDVGGGNGQLIASLLQKHPAMAGVLVDLPHVIEKAKPLLAAAGVADRCETVAADAFERVPRGGDVYLLSRVVHDWNDEHALAVLRTCRRSMQASAKLLVVERIVPDASRDESAAIFLSDLHMMVMTGGRERSHDEFEKLLDAGGFALLEILPMPLGLNVLEAAPV